MTYPSFISSPDRRSCQLIVWRRVRRPSGVNFFL